MNTYNSCTHGTHTLDGSCESWSITEAAQWLQHISAHRWKEGAPWDRNTTCMQDLLRSQHLFPNSTSVVQAHDI